jgi:hypothetical protein
MLGAWDVVAALASVASAGAAAVAAWQSHSSAREANATALALAAIERDRRHSELCPRFRVACAPWGAGTDKLRLSIMLVGPPALTHLDSVTVTIRDDVFTRGQGPLYGGLTREQVKSQIWGPYRVSPGTGSHGAVADNTGRIVPFELRVPIGEVLLLQLEPTPPPPWSGNMSPQDWRRQQGNVLRLLLDAEHLEHGSWTLPCEVDVGGDGNDPVTVYAPAPD